MSIPLEELPTFQEVLDTMEWISQILHVFFISAMSDDT